jgi:hypothetical protein
MKALPPVPVISTSGFDRAVACSDELVGDRCRLRHKIRTHSAGCYGQSQAGQDRPPGSRGDGVSYATDLRVGSGMFVAPPNLRRTLARRRHRVFRAHNGSGLAAETSEYSACDDNVADRGPCATRGLQLWHVTSLRLRRWHDVQQPLLHPDRDLGDDVHRLAALGVDGGRPSRAERQLPGHCLVAEKNFDGISAA